MFTSLKFEVKVRRLLREELRLSLRCLVKPAESVTSVFTRRGSCAQHASVDGAQSLLLWCQVASTKIFVAHTVVSACAGSQYEDVALFGISGSLLSLTRRLRNFKYFLTPLSRKLQRTSFLWILKNSISLIFCQYVRTFYAVEQIHLVARQVKNRYNS